MGGGGNRERRCGEGKGEASYLEVIGSLRSLNVWSGQKTKWSPSKMSLVTLSSQIIFPAWPPRVEEHPSINCPQKKNSFMKLLVNYISECGICYFGHLCVWFHCSNSFLQDCLPTTGFNGGGQGREHGGTNAENGDRGTGVPQGTGTWQSTHPPTQSSVTTGYGCVTTRVFQ